MIIYAEQAILQARLLKLTAAEVAAMGYSQVAGLAGVEVAPDGSSPADFFYEGVRNATVGELAGDSQGQLLLPEGGVI